MKKLIIIIFISMSFLSQVKTLYSFDLYSLEKLFPEHIEYLINENVRYKLSSGLLYSGTAVAMFPLVLKINDTSLWTMWLISTCVAGGYIGSAILPKDKTIGYLYHNREKGIVLGRGITQSSKLMAGYLNLSMGIGIITIPFIIQSYGEMFGITEEMFSNTEKACFIAGGIIACIGGIIELVDGFSMDIINRSEDMIKAHNNRENNHRIKLAMDVLPNYVGIKLAKSF